MLENEIDKMLNNSDSADSHNHKRKSLGRGLGALLGEDDLDLDNVEDLSSLAPAPATANLVDIDLIKPGKFQPRTEFDQEALQSLAESIKEKGVLQPLLVRRDGIGFEIIAGERRWRASKLAGLDKVPVIEKDLSDKEVLEVALVENLLRENLSAIEEAEGLQRLIDEFSHTQEALSQIIGKSRSHIANTGSVPLPIACAVFSSVTVIVCFPVIPASICRFILSSAFAIKFCFLLYLYHIITL